MKLILSKSMLKRITQDVLSGRPLWGIFTANEYLEHDDPLRLALLTKASSILKDERYQQVPQLILAAMAGKTVNQLADYDRINLFEFKENYTINYTRNKFVPHGRRAYHSKDSRSRNFLSSSL